MLTGHKSHIAGGKIADRSTTPKAELIIKCECHKIGSSRPNRICLYQPTNPSRPRTMNFDSYTNNSSSSLSTSFHDSIDQFQFRTDSPSIAKHSRTNARSENPVPVPYSPVSPAFARSTHNLQLSPRENRGRIEMPSFSSGLALRDDCLAVHHAIGKGA